jgi:hypothetical protein
LIVADDQAVLDEPRSDLLVADLIGKPVQTQL